MDDQTRATPTATSRRRRRGRHQPGNRTRRPGRYAIAAGALAIGTCLAIAAIAPNTVAEVAISDGTSNT
jgi:hypothetical protein